MDQYRGEEVNVTVSTVGRFVFFKVCLNTVNFELLKLEM